MLKILQHEHHGTDVELTVSATEQSNVSNNVVQLHSLNVLEDVDEASQFFKCSVVLADEWVVQQRQDLQLVRQECFQRVLLKDFLIDNLTHKFALKWLVGPFDEVYGSIVDLSNFPNVIEIIKT